MLSILFFQDFFEQQTNFCVIIFISFYNLEPLTNSIFMSCCYMKECCSCDFYTIQSRLSLLTSEATCQSSLSEHYILSYLREVLTLLSKQLNLLLHSSVSDFKSYKFLFYTHMYCKSLSIFFCLLFHYFVRRISSV